MKESWKTRIVRCGFNLFPAFRGTGARVIYIAGDYSEIRIKLPLNWRTRNYVGTIFGGSMYGAVDPIYMYMFLKMLGNDYIVWDKAASIRFKKPGKSTLYATFKITYEELDEVKRALEGKRSLDRVYDVELVDESGTVHAVVEKTIYIRKKDRESNPSSGHVVSLPKSESK
ncbi:Acyl-coenzyme A thioesterase PaaI, contains HGG motif [Bacillus sp. OV194]|nr:Acyl-coenzyme A thioesterase PaaI, contains HGG motif [Bacillus sp. OV194]